ncbi:hypothetical protein ACTXT7_016026 [Hymenolepis weldensis]
MAAYIKGFAQFSSSAETNEILDAFLLRYRTTPHPVLNDHSPAETLRERKFMTIHNALLPMDSTFPSSSSFAKKTLATDTAVYVRDHWPNGT